jgi:hypothetical protein
MLSVARLTEASVSPPKLARCGFWLAVKENERDSYSGDL